MTNATDEGPDSDKVPTDPRPLLHRYNPKALWPLLGVLAALYGDLFAFCMVWRPWNRYGIAAAASGAIDVIEPLAVGLWLVVVASRVIVRKVLRRRADGIAFGLTLAAAALFGLGVGVYQMAYRIDLAQALAEGGLAAAVSTIIFAIPAAIAHFVVPDALRMPPDPPEAAADGEDTQA